MKEDKDLYNELFTPNATVEIDQSWASKNSTIVGQLQSQMRKMNMFKFEESEVRNVIFVGKSRSGKTTATNVLQDTCYQPARMSIFSETDIPDFQTFTLKDENTNTRYTFNIIDTPGLKEVKPFGEVAREDTAIINTINYCLKNEVTKINCLLIFASFEVGIAKGDIDSIQNFVEKFAHKQIAVYLCITRFESKTEEDKLCLKAQLEQHSFFQPLLAEGRFKIAYLGAIDATSNIYASRSELKGAYEKVYKLREELLQLLFNAKSTVDLRELPISTEARKDLIKRFDEQAEYLNFFDKCQKFQGEQFMETLYKFEINLRVINESGLLVGEGIRKKFLDMQERMRNIVDKSNPTMDAELKKRFFGPLHYLDKVAK
jgi:GTPase SAR1 family protein